MESPLFSPRSWRCLILLVAGTFAVPSCRPAEPELAPAFQLVQVRPKPGRRVGVFLNEALTFHFSDPIDPASVTRESLTIREPGQRATARGRFEIDKDHVIFHPELGSKSDLTDGGFRPGTTYELVLLGFPALDGLRSTGGRILDRSHRLVIETVELTEPRGQMFDDDSPGVPQPLSLKSTKVELGGPVVFECKEPIDPRTVVAGEFWLELERTNEPVERIPLRLGKLVNTRRGGTRLEGGARLELVPERPLIARMDYRLAYARVVSVRDFGGNPVWPPIMPGQGPSLTAYEERRPELVENFLDSTRRSRLAVPDVDGTAAWLGTGTVGVRYLAAAGDGRDGAIRLGATEGRRDLHATSLVLAEGIETELLSVPGLVVLRSQGRMSISGRLGRNCGEGPSLGFRGEALSAWLERAREQDASWTVLIAGGDLVIDGEIDVEGPLLLAAGGRIRVTGLPGSVRAQASDLWLAGEGGGRGLDDARQWVDLDLALELDPPLRNPLVDSLTFAVLSAPLPQYGGVDRWLGAEVQLRDNWGKASVRFVVNDVPLDAPLEEWGAVDEITDLPTTKALRLLIELTVDPPDPSLAEGKGLRWDPPVVDEVRLFWDEVQPGGR